MTRMAFPIAAAAALIAWCSYAGAQGEAPTAPEPTASEQAAHDFLEQAVELWSDEAYAEAEALCREAIAENPRGLLAYHVLWLVKDDEAGYSPVEPAPNPHLDALKREWRAGGKRAPKDPVATFKAGMVDESEGKYEEAAAKYEAVLAQGLDDPVLHAHLGAVQAKLGRNEEAARNLQTAADREPLLDEPGELLPDVYISLKQWDRAEQALKRLDFQWFPDPELLDKLAGVQAEQGAMGRAALTVLRSSAVGRRRDTAIAFPWRLAAVWAAHPTWKAALLLWLIPTALAVPLWWFASRERPGRPDIWLAGISLLLVFLLFSPATAPRLAGTPGGAGHQLMVMYLWAVVLLLFSLPVDGLFDRVRGRVRTKSSIVVSFLIGWVAVPGIMQLFAGPSEYRINWWAMLGLAVLGMALVRRGPILCDLAVPVHYKKGRYDKAISLINTALKTDRSKDCRVRALAYLGDCYMAQGDLEQALRLSEAAMALDAKPVSGAAAAQAASICVMMGRYEAAMEFLGKARAMSAKMQAFQGIVDASEAELLLAHEQYYYALQVLEAAAPRARLVRPLKTSMALLRARALAMLGDFAGATALCGQILKGKETPLKRSHAHTTMGIMWSASQNWAEAVKHFANATSAHPANSGAWLRQAHALAMMERWDEAREAMQRAAQSAPASKWAKMAAESLQADPQTWRDIPLPMHQPPQAPPIFPPQQQGPPPLGSPVPRPRQGPS